MVRKRKYPFVGVLLALIVATALLPGGSVAAQMSEDDPLSGFAPALLPDYVSDMDAHADAPRYTIDITLALDHEGATISGEQQVIYTNRSPHALDRIVFRLYPNLVSYGGAMVVARVLVDGAPAAPDLDETGTVLSVPLASPLAPGERVTLALNYEIRVRAGVARLYKQFSYLDNVLALPNAYPVLSVYEAGDGWWVVADHTQGDAVYSESAFFEVTLRAPEDLIVVASGTEVSVRTGEDGLLVHEYVAPLMRDFAIMAAPHYVTQTGTVDGVAITLYYDPARPDAEAIAAGGLRAAQAAVGLFNSLFGAYPFAELDIVQTPTSAGGIEYPGLIVIGDDAWDENADRFIFVLVHEIAHQWWYSLVGNDQTLDPWMDEALAQFATALFIGALEGGPSYSAAINSYEAQYARYLQLAEDLDQPIGLPVSDYTGTAYFSIVYQKGPLFFDALAETYGGAAVLDALQDYFAAYRYDIAEPVDMLLSFEQSLDADLHAIFEEWVGDFPVG
ncbi:MAG: M1 family metallopeptidase [Chloroflexi bacterium]|nr:M1 family metallopeptidase [Chloroflexota bacterium]